MHLSIEKQEEFYRERWQLPIESVFKGAGKLKKLNALLSEFVKDKSGKGDYVSDAETTYMKCVKASSLTPEEKQFVTTYAQFVSLFEKSGKDKMISEENKEYLKDVSVEIMSDIAKFISRKMLDCKKESETW